MLQGNISQELGITDKDQSIARNALDLSAFSELEELTRFAELGKESSQ
jgi:hypothetical protein